MTQEILTAVMIHGMKHEDLVSYANSKFKKMYFQMNTSGSPSCWTEYPEYEVENTPEAFMECVQEINNKWDECDNHPGWNFDAHISLVY